MNHSELNEDDNGSSYEVQYRRAGESAPRSNSRSQRGTFGRRRGKSPQQFNGIHRRRCKKIRW